MLLGHDIVGSVEGRSITVQNPINWFEKLDDGTRREVLETPSTVGGLAFDR
jgi:hypothetical protein